MAALVVDEKFDLGTLQQHLLTLPPYARPLFLRIVAEIERTGTFRLKKAELASQGYDPSRIADELYLADGEQGRYVPFDTRLHDLILAGQVRL